MARKEEEENKDKKEQEEEEEDFDENEEEEDEEEGDVNNVNLKDFYDGKYVSTCGVWDVSETSKLVAML